MESTSLQPVVSTYVHVPREARVSHSVDSSSFGVSASIRVGEHGQNDAVLFFRTAEQLDQLAAEAIRAAKQLRSAMRLKEEIELASRE